MRGSHEEAIIPSFTQPTDLWIDSSFWVNLKPGMAIKLFNLLRTPPLSWLHICPSWDFRSLSVVGCSWWKGLLWWHRRAEVVPGTISSVFVLWVACYPCFIQPHHRPMSLVYILTFLLLCDHASLSPFDFLSSFSQLFSVHIWMNGISLSWYIFPCHDRLLGPMFPWVSVGKGWEMSNQRQNRLFKEWYWANWKAIWKKLKIDLYVTPYAE